MRYRNYKSYSIKSKQSLPNYISECVVDYFIESNIVHPYIINTTIIGKSCNIYLPNTNLFEIKNYLFTKNFELFNSFSEINFITQKNPTYSDTLNYGNYYGYAIKNDLNSIPKGKELSKIIVSNLNEYKSHICQLTFDVDNNHITDLTILTTDKTVSKEDITSLVFDYIRTTTKINVIYYEEVNSDFNTNNNNLHGFYEIPSSNLNMIGSDPNSPNRIIPLYLRYMSKNIVNSSLMDECLISVNYSQNSITPITLNINGFGTENFNKKNIYNCIMDVFPLTLKQIKNEIDFFKPIYRQSYLLDYYIDNELPWGKLDKNTELIIF